MTRWFVYSSVFSSVAVITVLSACDRSVGAPADSSADAGNGDASGESDDDGSLADSGADGDAHATDAATLCPADGCVLATDSGASRIAVDGTYLYWASKSGVKRVPVNGGASSTIAPLGDGETFANGITIHAGNVFWTTGALTLGKGTVSRVLVDGGSPLTLATAQDGLSIAADDTNVYWQEVASLKKVAVDGGATSFVSSGGGFVGAIALNGGVLYWGSTKIMKASVTGGAPIPLTTNILTGETPIAADATNVYFINAGTLSKVAVGGGTPITLATPGSSSDTAIAVDETHVYYTTSPGATTNDARIAKVPIGGGTPTVIASNLPAPVDLTVDANSVYWIGGGVIRRLPK